MSSDIQLVVDEIYRLAPAFKKKDWRQKKDTGNIVVYYEPQEMMEDLFQTIEGDLFIKPEFSSLVLRKYKGTISIDHIEFKNPPYYVIGWRRVTSQSLGNYSYENIYTKEIIPVPPRFLASKTPRDSKDIKKIIAPQNNVTNQGQASIWDFELNPPFLNEADFNKKITEVNEFLQREGKSSIDVNYSVNNTLEKQKYLWYTLWVLKGVGAFPRPHNTFSRCTKKICKNKTDDDGNLVDPIFLGPLGHPLQLKVTDDGYCFDYSTLKQAFEEKNNNINPTTNLKTKVRELKSMYPGDKCELQEDWQLRRFY